MDLRAGEAEIDLGGEWGLAWTATPPERALGRIADVEAANLTRLRAQVPGCLELDLERAGVIPDPFHGMNVADLREWERVHAWYTRRFTCEASVGRDAVLEFGGLDCYATLYLNGERVGTTDNMLVEHAFEVTGLLRGENELVVHLKPAIEEASRFDYPRTSLALGSNYESLFVRKAPHMYGWDIMPRAVSMGIWRPVRLRFLPRERLETVCLDTLAIAPDGSDASMGLYYRARLAGGPSDVYEVSVAGVCGESRFETRHRALFDAGTVRFGVHRPALWWPRGRGDASLYDVRVALLKDGEEIDRVALTLGIRTVALERTSVTDEEGTGQFRFRVNGEPLFVKGSNWVPLDAFHARDRSRVDAAMALAEDLECNMLRCWGGSVYEDDRFYELCDRAGILVWQDFAMACAVYPQDPAFGSRLAEEARKVVRRLRQHACIALWSGDNECDVARAWSGLRLDPNANVLTRKVLPGVLAEEDPLRPYLPSSPYIDERAHAAGERYLPENHLWGPRDYFKSPYYTGSLCHFASEIGYHGCPSPESLRRFLSPDRLWPYVDNPEWRLHSTSPVPGVDLFDHRVELMANQVRELFGAVPSDLDGFAWASQASQAEAAKFFVELFRAQKWRRTGILWWNLLDGWPQFSDAVVDYYFAKKLAYAFLKRAQAPLLLALREPASWGQELVACNDTRTDLPLSFRVRDTETGETMAEGSGRASADAVTVLARIPFSASWKRLYRIEWEAGEASGASHYLAGYPPFDLCWYRRALEAAGMTSAA